MRKVEAGFAFTHMKRTLMIHALIAVGMLKAEWGRAQGVESYEQPPLSYSATNPRDAVAKLQARMASGELKWTGDGKEILRRLLKELRVPI